MGGIILDVWDGVLFEFLLERGAYLFVAGRLQREFDNFFFFYKGLP